MAHIECRGAGERREIEIKGALGIQDAVRLAGELCGLGEKEGEVLIDLRQTTAIDLACMQILCAAHRTYGGLPGGPCLRAALSDAVRDTVAEIGIEPSLCGAETSGACLWRGV